MMSASVYAYYQQRQWLWHGCRWEYFAFTGGFNQIFLVILKQLIVNHNINPLEEPQPGS